METPAAGRSRFARVHRSSVVPIFWMVAVATAASANPFTGQYATGSGPNRFGTLVLHSNPSLVYTSDTVSYCDSAGVARCDDIFARTDREDLVVVHLLAAFPPESSPRVSGVVFGLRYPHSLVIEDVQKCADFFLPTESWPSSGSGVAVTWMTPRTASLFDVYWFAVSVLPGESGRLSVIPHSVQGAYFADDSVPAHLDEVRDLGSFGFHAVGDTPCPIYEELPGACCFPDGNCTPTTSEGCAAAEGIYRGDGTDCQPNPCPEPRGACCFQNGWCSVLTAPQCDASLGEYLGEGATCIPNPCQQPPTGACCLPAGECEIATADECANAAGSYRGDDFSCIPNPCPSVGACCLGSSCRVWIEFACEQSGGIWVDGQICDPSPCEFGACCFDAGFCVRQSVATCVVEGGLSLGDGTHCDPNPCPNPCTRTDRQVLIDASGSPRSTRPALATVPPPPRDPFADVRASRSNVEYGPHRGGTLLLHANPSISYSGDSGEFCGRAGLLDCGDTIDRADDPGTHVVHVLAAFHEQAAPELIGVAFGIEYGACVDPFDHSPCADFESPTPNWPASGEGTLVVWAAPQRSHLTEVYWFAAYHDSPFVDALRLVPHPAFGGWFVDDSTPAVGDAIADYGSFGFGQPGRAPCPIAPALLGACCVGEQCVPLLNEQCSADHGIFLGAGVPCEPDLCDFADCRPAVSSRQLSSPSFQRLEGGGQEPTAPADTACGELFLHADGTYEHAFAWSGSGVAPPAFGAFAECYEGVSGFLVCSIVLDLTQVGGQAGQTLDAYVWQDFQGCPGNVLCVRTGFDPGPIAVWPALSRHVVPLEECCVYAGYWVGYWGAWPGDEAGWYIGSDAGPSNGCAATLVAPDRSATFGWQLLADSGGLGIGCEIAFHCGGVPVETTTWGRVKMLFR